MKPLPRIFSPSDVVIDPDGQEIRLLRYPIGYEPAEYEDPVHVVKYATRRPDYATYLLYAYTRGIASPLYLGCAVKMQDGNFMRVERFDDLEAFEEIRDELAGELCQSGGNHSKSGGS